MNLNLASTKSFFLSVTTICLLRAKAKKGAVSEFDQVRFEYVAVEVKGKYDITVTNYEFCKILQLKPTTDSSWKPNFVKPN